MLPSTRQDSDEFIFQRDYTAAHMTTNDTLIHPITTEVNDYIIQNKTYTIDSAKGAGTKHAALPYFRLFGYA